MIQADSSDADSSEKVTRSSEWQPIESAVQDGKPVLISGGTYYCDDETFRDGVPFTGVKIARWDEGCDEWNGGYGSGYDAEYWHNPTHWMPLPAPPSNGDREVEPERSAGQGTEEMTAFAYQDPDDPSYHGKKTSTCLGCGGKCAKSAWGPWCHPCNVERMDRISASMGALEQRAKKEQKR